MGSGIWKHVIQELGSASERLRRRATHQTSALLLSWVNLLLDLRTQAHTAAGEDVVFDEDLCLAQTAI